MKTINILGDTQAEQWKTVVHILRACGGDMDYKGRDSLCSELDRYIEWAEKTIAELNAETERLEREAKAESRIAKAVFGALLLKPYDELNSFLGNITIDEMEKLYYNKLSKETFNED